MIAGYSDSESYGDFLMSKANNDFEEWLKHRPVCPYCRDLIVEDYGLFGGNDWWHKECFVAYIKNVMKSSEVDEGVIDTAIEAMENNLMLKAIEE